MIKWCCFYGVLANSLIYPVPVRFQVAVFTVEFVGSNAVLTWIIEKRVTLLQHVEYKKELEENLQNYNQEIIRLKMRIINSHTKSWKQREQ